MTHPAQAVLDHERWRNQVLRQVRLEERARALVLQQELRSMRTTMRHVTAHEAAQPPG